MNFVILGDGPEELAWALRLAEHPEHRVLACHPGFKARPDLPGADDLEEALATSELDAAVVGGPLEYRAEALRRAAAAGWTVLCLHPPGPDADAYYQVSLSREETGAVIVPVLPARRHPGVAVLREAIADGRLGPLREIRLETTVGPADVEGELLDHAFPRVVDVVRALVGEIEAVTATGDPPGARPTESLIVQLRGSQHRRAEVRLWRGTSTTSGEPVRLAVSGVEGSLTLEFDPETFSEAQLIHRSGSGEPSVTVLAAWDPHHAMLEALGEAVAAREQEVHPGLFDGIRALELTEATARSLARGRTMELHLDQLGEVGQFKSIMTSLGCLVLLSALVALPIALVGPALGFPWTLYIAYAIPPLLIGFILLQLLRFAVRSPSSRASGAAGGSRPDGDQVAPSSSSPPDGS